MGSRNIYVASHAGSMDNIGYRPHRRNWTEPTVCAAIIVLGVFCVVMWSPNAWTFPGSNNHLDMLRETDSDRRNVRLPPWTIYESMNFDCWSDNIEWIYVCVYVHTLYIIMFWGFLPIPVYNVEINTEKCEWSGYISPRRSSDNYVLGDWSALISIVWVGSLTYLFFVSFGSVSSTTSSS